MDQWSNEYLYNTFLYFLNTFLKNCVRYRFIQFNKVTTILYFRKSNIKMLSVMNFAACSLELYRYGVHGSTWGIQVL